jgi:hypothetical protein
MRRIRMLRVCVLSVSIAITYVAGTALADPLFVEAMGLEVWQIGRLERDLKLAQVRDTRLERELQTVLDRAVVHNLMLDDLAAGRVTLAETARRKWEMNRHRLEIRDHLARNCAGPTMEARMAHDLCLKVIGNLEFERRDPRLIARRLTAEYETAYGVPYPTFPR